MIMKTPTIKWFVMGAVGAGLLVLATGANAASSTGAAVSQPVPSPMLQLAAKDCGGVIKASAMKDDKMAKDAAMKDDKMAKDVMKDDKMAKDDMKTDVMAKAKNCADKDTMTN